MTKYENISDIELLDFLTRYTDEFLRMLKEDNDLATCKKIIDEIIHELKMRNGFPRVD